MVIVGHWLGLHRLHFANIGVEIFFVLSGFLITLILLKNKLPDETAATQNTAGILKKFYIRRFLRIFPVYYLVLLLCYVFSYPNDSIKQHFVWDILYLNNVYAWLYNLKLKSFIHLWSLSVEEQFYLIWPWLILLTPVKHLRKVLLGTIAIGLLFRALYYAPFSTILVNHPAGVTLLPACFDLFAWGGLLAYYFKYEPKVLFSNVSRKYYMLAAGLAIMAACIALEHNGWLFNTFFRIGSAMATLAMILVCLGTAASPFDYALNNAALIYVGKISYGLYLFHLLYKDILLTQAYALVFGHEPRFAVVLIMRFVLLMVVATVSWYFFEKPINDLKDKLAAYDGA